MEPRGAHRRLEGPVVEPVKDIRNHLQRRKFTAYDTALASCESRKCVHVVSFLCGN